MSGDGIPAGWYEDPENADQLRFWDGTQWTDQRQPAPGAAAPPPPPPPGAGMPPPPPPSGGYAQSVPGQSGMQSDANKALALSIGGILCCGPLAIAGIVIGRAELQAIDQGSGDPAKRGTANAAYIIGIIAVVIWALLLIGRLAVL